MMFVKKIFNYKQYIRNKKGQSLVEIALLLPLLLLILMGTLDFGRYLYTHMHLHMATQETVRIAGLGATDQQLQEFITNYTNVNDPAALTLTVTPTQANRTSGDYVTVSLQYDMDLLTPFVQRFITVPFDINTESTIRIE